MLQKAGFGFGKVSTGPISSEQTIFYTDKVPQYAYDPAKAETMLDEAGFPQRPDGIRFPLRVTFDEKEGPMDDTAKLMRAAVRPDRHRRRSSSRSDSDCLARQVLQELGLRRHDGQLLDRPRSGDRHRAALRLPQHRARSSRRNASGYCNPKLDEIFAAAAKELDETKRVTLYHEVQNILAEDVPHLWLWDRYYPIAFNAKLTACRREPTQYGALRPGRLDRVVPDDARGDGAARTFPPVPWRQRPECRSALYLLKRLIYSIPLLIGRGDVIFVLIHAAPGDPIDYIIGDAAVDQEFIDRLRARWGSTSRSTCSSPNTSLQVAKGDLGFSFVRNTPVLDLILDRLPATLLLMATQYVLLDRARHRLGVLSARRPNSGLRPRRSPCSRSAASPSRSSGSARC